MASISPPGSYSSAQPQQPQDPSIAYKYEDPTGYQMASGYGNQFDVPIPLQRSEEDVLPREPSRGQGTGSSEPKVRLRKACDACSVRKVKVSALC